MNMKQYYEGFLDFGCTLKEIGDLKARRFKYRDDDSRFPIFQCELTKEGCHSDSDCHRGPNFFATYCYGSTCLEHVKPPYGSKADTISARKSRTGSYGGEINDSCKLEADFTAGCHNNNDNEIIWGEGTGKYDGKGKVNGTGKDNGKDNGKGKDKRADKSKSSSCRRYRPSFLFVPFLSIFYFLVM